MQQVRRVGVLSVAKIMGITYAALAVLFIPFFLLVGVAGMFSNQQNAPFGAAFMLVFAILMPVIYGIMGFLGGALMAFVYNVAAGKLGGFEIELVPSHPALLPTTQSGGVASA